MPHGGNRATAATALQPSAAPACAIMGATEVSFPVEKRAELRFADREGRGAIAEGQEHP